MNQQSDQLRPLALLNTNFVDEQAFESDLLGRKKLADQLTSYLDRLKVGAVLAIDAPWGEGKTWCQCRSKNVPNGAPKVCQLIE